MIKQRADLWLCLAVKEASVKQWTNIHCRALLNCCVKVKWKGPQAVLFRDCEAGAEKRSLNHPGLKKGPKRPMLPKGSCIFFFSLRISRCFYAHLYLRMEGNCTEIAGLGYG